MSDKLAPSNKFKFVRAGKTVYEWDQTLSEVNVYIEVPAGVKAKQLYVEITSTHVRLGIHPNPPYLDVSFATLRNTAGWGHREAWALASLQSILSTPTIA